MKRERRMKPQLGFQSTVLIEPTEAGHSGSHILRAHKANAHNIVHGNQAECRCKVNLDLEFHHLLNALFWDNN